MTDTVVRVIDLHMMRWKNGVPEYLLLQRSPGQIYAGVWQGVTGKIKADETAWQAAIRELTEETGLQPIRFWTIDHVNFYYDAAHDRMNAIPVFGAELAAGEPVLSAEHRDCRWCPVDEAVELLLWEQQKAGLRIFHDMLTEATAKLKWMKIEI